jgi:hypothetical protein
MKTLNAAVTVPARWQFCCDRFHLPWLDLFLCFCDIKTDRMFSKRIELVITRLLLFSLPDLWGLPIAQKENSYRYSAFNQGHRYLQPFITVFSGFEELEQILGSDCARSDYRYR